MEREKLEESIRAFTQMLKDWNIAEPELTLVIGNVRRLQNEAYTINVTYAQKEILGRVSGELCFMVDEDDPMGKNIRKMYNNGVMDAKRIIQKHVDLLT